MVFEKGVVHHPKQNHQTETTTYRSTVLGRNHQEKWRIWTWQQNRVWKLQTAAEQSCTGMASSSEIKPPYGNQNAHALQTWCSLVWSEFPPRTERSDLKRPDIQEDETKVAICKLTPDTFQIKAPHLCCQQNTHCRTFDDTITHEHQSLCLNIYIYIDTHIRRLRLSQPNKDLSVSRLPTNCFIAVNKVQYPYTYIILIS